MIRRPGPISLTTAALLASAAIGGFFGRRARRNFNDIPTIEPLGEDVGNGDDSFVSVIVPARNEELNLRRVVESILAQSHTNLELIVVDDGSTDRTAEIASQYPLELVHCDDPPDGWTGKNHACHVGRGRASGEWLLFTDADTHHLPHTLNSVLAYARDNRLDAVSVAPFLECGSLFERLLMPMIQLQFLIGIPGRLINRPEEPYGVAFGHYMLLRSDEYDRIGGHESVKSSITEDHDLALLMKRMRVRFHFTTGYKMVSSRMYRGLSEVIAGFGKNVPQFVRRARLDGIGAMINVIALGLYPMVSIAALRQRKPATILAALTVYLTIVRQLQFHFKVLKLPAGYALLHPVSSVLSLYIVCNAAVKGLLLRRVEWKGRTYDASRFGPSDGEPPQADRSTPSVPARG